MEMVPARCLTAAVMQGAKATFGMHSMSYSVWCKCKRGGAHHKHPKEDVATPRCWSIARSWAARSRRTTSSAAWRTTPRASRRAASSPASTCSCCGYSPTEKQWQADLKNFNEMTDREQKARRDAH
eukprot:7378027-Prymnesium_polylepis.1